MKQALDKTNFAYISSLFGYKQILKHEVDKVTFDFKNAVDCYSDVFEEYYKTLIENYRCEYIYKNEILNQLLLNHSAKAKLYTEVEVFDSKADVVIFNGTSTVYEIKTELDSFDRLQKQLSAYKLVFDKINVVTHLGKLERVKKILDSDIGILVLNDKGIIETERDAKSNKQNTNPNFVFNLLHKDEYLSILRKHFGFTPDVAPVHIFRECKKMFLELNPEIAHDYMVEALKERKTKKYLEKLMDELPASLKLIGTYNKLTKKECQEITLKLCRSTAV
ncbi:MAG: sce7726 family protein [Bacteroidia bacterium]|nr:sce7726 family protein [Bacteroidia bacterium]